MRFTFGLFKRGQAQQNHYLAFNLFNPGQFIPEFSGCPLKPFLVDFGQLAGHHDPGIGAELFADQRY